MKPDKNEPDDMEAEFDFSDGVRGEFAKQLADGCRIVVADENGYLRAWYGYFEA